MLALLLALLGMAGLRLASERLYCSNYPKEYAGYVEPYARQYGIDPHFVYAVIKTESDFDPSATSPVGARGLMQIMSDTFDWVRQKSGHSEVVYDDMYDPEMNIRFGVCLISMLYEEFGSYETTLAAYHAGRGAAGRWLRDGRYSSNGRTLDEIPIPETNHYVRKVMDCYAMYQELYA